MSLAIFPVLPSMDWDSVKTQSWDTTIQKYGSGRRKAMSKVAWPTWKIECSFKALDPDDIEKAAGFFGMVRGALTPFLWLDPEDYQETGTRIGAGTGETAEYQLLRNLGGYYAEPVLDVVPNTLVVYADGVPVAFTLGDDGKVSLSATSGAAITADFKYYWRVAFSDDDMEMSNFWYNFYKLNKFSVVTVK